MRNLYFLAVAGITVFAFLGCATGESMTKAGINFAQYKRVAILPFEYRTRNNQISVEDYFEQELMGKGYNIVERIKIESMLKELQFQQSDLTDQDKTAQIGKFLNVDALLSGVVSISSSRDDINVDISVKLTSVEDASILWSGSGSTEGGGVLGGIIGGIGKGLVQDTKVSTEVKGVVKKICKKFPSSK